jgi:uncharacterized protein YwqG
MRNIFNIFKSKAKPSSKLSWEDLKPILDPYKRLAWFPNIVEKGSNPMASKFSGIPALSIDEGWPCCVNCNEPMQLFLQLNAKDLPESERNVFGKGMLQVFYCTNWDKECEVNCEAFFPFSKSTLVRVVDYGPEVIASPEKNPVKEAFPERQIVGWESKEDYPNWEELENIGVTLNDEQSDLLCNLEYPLPKDKLLGWPYWVQGVEYPDCPECGTSMKLIFQIDSEDNLPYMFGDVGSSHITQCENHKDKLAIAWACS